MSVLAVRFVRWIALISLVITLGGICLATYLEYLDDLRGIREQVDGVQTFVPTLSTSVWRLDDDQIEIQLQGISQLPAVRAAGIVIDGVVVYQQPPDAFDGAPEGADAQYDLTFESAGTVHPLGTLLVVADRRYATDRVPMRFAEIAAIQGVRGLVIAAVFLWVFSHLVGRRLKTLAEDIGAIDWASLQNRPFSLEDADDELAAVRDTLESMRVKVVEGMQREQEARDELEYRRLFDPVTGLPNRNLLADRLETLRLSGARSPLVVVVIELLRLSEIDQLLGGPSMHHSLRQVARSLQEIAGSSGLLSRYSERRFVLVTGPVADQDAADRLVSRIAARFEQPVLAPDGRAVFFSAAFGVSRAEPGEAEEVDADKLLSRAVLALEVAIGQGDGARVHWGAHLRHGVESIYQELRTALNEGDFAFHCQPLLDLDSGDVDSIECLIRWRSDRLMAHGIQETIHVLEHSGMSSQLDRAVLDAALSLRQRLADVYRGPLAINLTARSLSDAAFAEYIAECRSEWLDGLELEITETHMLPDVATAQRLAERCGDLGLKLVLDDFGTGFSSIEYLGHFQFHAIKIDRSFMRSGLNNQQRLLQSMVSIAHGVGSRVVAEGIEDHWQLDLARELAVDSGQGYLFGKPMNEVELRQYLVHREPVT